MALEHKEAGTPGRSAARNKAEEVLDGLDEHVSAEVQATMAVAHAALALDDTLRRLITTLKMRGST